MTRSATARAINYLSRLRSAKARQAGYEELARQNGRGFADHVRDAVESSLLIEANERAIESPGEKKRRG